MTLFSSALLLSYYLGSIFAELNLNHRLIYASRTSAMRLPRAAQVKTIKLGCEQAACELCSLPPVYCLQPLSAEDGAKFILSLG